MTISASFKYLTISTVCKVPVKITLLVSEYFSTIIFKLLISGPSPMITQLSQYLDKLCNGFTIRLNGFWSNVILPNYSILKLLLFLIQKKLNLSEKMFWKKEVQRIQWSCTNVSVVRNQV